MGRMSRDSERKRPRWFPGLGILDDIKDITVRMPSEETLLRFLEALPRIEAIIHNQKLDKVAKLGVLADAFEDGTIDRLVNFAPLLRNVPDNTTLVDLANMRPMLVELIGLIRKMPSPEELRALVALLEDVRGFLGALRGVQV